MRKVYFYIMLLVLANSIYAQFNDPLLSTQNNLFAIEVPTVWQNRTIGENNIVVAVFGMGVDISHPDLNDNIFINTDEIPSNGLDDDNNGYVDDINGWNFYDNNSNILPYVLNDDNYYHETKVAGIIGAEINNGEGIIGVAPGCKILPIKFYKNATAVSEPDFSEKLAAAFNYIAALKNQFPDKKFVINFSYGFDNAELDEQIVTLAIANCLSNNIPVFASAGNITGKPIKYPANLSATICVTGVIGTNSRLSRTIPRQ